MLWAINGAPGVGKTALAVQLTLAMRRQKHVLLVLCDAENPPKAYLLPKAERTVSLGALLTAVDLDDGVIWRAVTPIENEFGILGYNPDDKPTSFPALTRFGINQFVDRISAMADLVIFDLPTTDNLLSEVLQQRSDRVISIITATPKHTAWALRHAAQMSDVIVLNQYRSGQMEKPLETALIVQMPESKELVQHYNNMELFKPFKDKVYQKALDELIRQLKLEAVHGTNERAQQKLSGERLLESGKERKR